MEQIFLRLLNLSISAGWLILAVFAVRLIFRKAPKWVFGVLWALVALRLLVPFTLESTFSLQPSAEVVPQEIVTMEKPEIHTGIPSMNHAVNPMIASKYSRHLTAQYPTGIVADNPAAISPDTAVVKPAVTPENTETAVPEKTPMERLIHTATLVWLGGTVLMLGYALISYLHIRRKIGEAYLLRDNIWASDRIPSPFLLGLIRPKIYLPTDLEEEAQGYALAHEQAHLKRRDYLWKPLGFVLLSVYWFQPLMWLAYILLCRDIELACDEKVIKTLGAESKRPYSEALIGASVSRRSLTACPLAFGEVGVKERVKNVLNYRKPAFWVIVVSLLACAAVAVLFLTSPKSVNKEAEKPAETKVEEEKPPVATLWFNNRNPPLWEDHEITLPEFPDVKFVFQSDSYKLFAEKDGEQELLLDFIWAVYLCDLNGDGKPEFCSDSTQPGASFEKILVYDYANGEKYQLGGTADYCLAFEDNTLYVETRSEPYGSYVRTGPLTEDQLTSFRDTFTKTSAYYYLALDGNRQLLYPSKDLEKFREKVEKHSAVYMYIHDYTKDISNLGVDFNGDTFNVDVLELIPDDTDKMRITESHSYSYLVRDEADGGTYYLVSQKPDATYDDWLKEKDKEVPSTMLLFFAKDAELQLWFDESQAILNQKITVDAFPGVTFLKKNGTVYAEKNGVETELFSGSPIRSVYFFDVDLDGLPELCANVSFGNGWIDTRVVIYDYDELAKFEVFGNGTTDYRFVEENGWLYLESSESLKNQYTREVILDKSFANVITYAVNYGDIIYFDINQDEVVDDIYLFKTILPNGSGIAPMAFDYTNMTYYKLAEVDNFTVTQFQEKNGELWAWAQDLDDPNMGKWIALSLENLVLLDAQPRLYPREELEINLSEFSPMQWKPFDFDKDGKREALWLYQNLWENQFGFQLYVAEDDGELAFRKEYIVNAKNAALVRCEDGKLRVKLTPNEPDAAPHLFDIVVEDNAIRLVENGKDIEELFPCTLVY